MVGGELTGSLWHRAGRGTVSQGTIHMEGCAGETWLPGEESNLHSGIQSPLSYH